MKIPHKFIFENLKAKNVLPLQLSEAKYAEQVREVILTKVGQPTASEDSALYRRATLLSKKFSKNCRYNWKRGHRMADKGFFSEEMEVPDIPHSVKLENVNFAMKLLKIT